MSDHQTKKPFKEVFSILDRAGKQVWTKIGVAFTNKDGSINIQLNALPLSGNLQIRDPNPAYQSSSHSNSTSPSFAHAQQKTPLPDSDTDYGGL